MTEPRDLEPAQHVLPAPEDGWAAADVAEDELVDDRFIIADPDSRVVNDGPDLR